MFCYKCGASMDESATTCPQCGTPTYHPPQAPAPGVGTGAGRAGVPPAETQRPGASAEPASRPMSTGTQRPVNPWLNVPPPAPYQGGLETENKAVLSLVLGILAIFPLGVLAGIPAIILGHLSKAEISKSLGRLKGDGMATAGLVMGYLSLALIPLALIIAAIVIPNLLRARIMANEAGAASAVRTVNTAQINYSMTYPQTGYASSLDALGSGDAACGEASALHACLVDNALACNATWCVKNGYKFHVDAVCGGASCTDYVITAVPLTGRSRSFCSLSDGIVRARSGIPPVEPLTSPDECKAWAMLR